MKPGQDLLMGKVRKLSANRSYRSFDKPYR
jgi:hypothetical protein